MTLENIVLLHAKAVDLATAGDNTAACEMFLRVIQEIRRSELFKEETSVVRGIQNDDAVQVFPMNETMISKDEISMTLAAPLAVFVRGNRYDKVSPQGIVLFVVAALFNLGASFHMSNGGVAKVKNAQHFYIKAINLLRTMPFSGSARPTLALLGAVLCNNLAAIAADSFDCDACSHLLDGLALYLDGLEEPLQWLGFNIILWRGIKGQHAPSA